MIASLRGAFFVPSAASAYWRLDGMKRSLAIILVLLLLIGALTGCGPDQEKIQEDFIAILDKPASQETIKEAEDYLDQYLSKVTEEYASQMVHQYEHYILSFDQEGINYDEWVGKYEKHISPPLNGFYQLMAEEQKSPMTDDTALRLSWEELVERAYEIEQFARENKEYEPLRDDLIWIYGNYMNALVMGTNGTPIFDYKTHEFSEEARSAYAAFINKFPDTTTAWALTEYFTYLDSIRYNMDYNDKVSSKLFFDTCDWLVSESGKRVFQ
jgi:hypothetical protein